MNAQSQLEHQLLAHTTAAYKLFGFPEKDALEQAQGCLAEAKKRMVERGEDQFPQNFGDWLLLNEKSNPQIQANLAAKRRAGCTDDDIRDWWNRPALERAMNDVTDESDRMALFLELMKSGASPEDAAAKVNNTHFVYGNLDPAAGENGPLAWELRSRVSAWEWKLRSAGTGRLQQLSATSSTLNALVRREIEAGAI